jgi:flagellar basal-body rod modification protein FlgD
MTQIAPVNGSNLPVVPQGSGQPQLDQTAFLRLMTTQLNAQDPFNPMDNTQMVAQMAQFSSVAGIAEMNSSLRAITEQISEQTSLLADLAARLDPPQTPQV